MNFMSELKIAQHYYDYTRTGPVTIDLHPTLACQNKCYFCISENFHVSCIDRANFSRKHSLDWEVLQRTIGEWKDMNVKAIQLTGGGEPTLYYKFPELLEEISSFKVGMITNGINVGKYAENICKSTDWIRISLDASNKKMYNRIKSADNFDKVIKSLRTLLDVRGNSVTPRIGIAYIITPESVSGIVEVAELLNAMDCRIDYLQFKDVLSRGVMFTEEYKTLIDNNIEVAQVYTGFPVLYTKHHSDYKREYERCFVTDYVAVLGADGNVYNCCHQEYIPECSNGSIYEKSFREIWENRKEVQINNNLCWNCRFMKTNDVLHSLHSIEDGDFI